MILTGEVDDFIYLTRIVFGIMTFILLHHLLQYYYLLLGNLGLFELPKSKLEKQTLLDSILSNIICLL